MISGTTLEDRVAYYTIMSSEDLCWAWKGAVDQNGYAQLRWKNKLYRVTSFFCRLVNGKVAMHTCNNGWCVNPRHIKAGTRTQNNVDALRDGLRTGKTAPKLFDEQIERIRNGNESLKKLAKEFGVSYSVVYACKTYRTYVKKHS